VICQSELVREALMPPSPEMLADVQRKLRAVKADGAALARLPAEHAPAGGLGPPARARA